MTSHGIALRLYTARGPYALLMAQARSDHAKAAIQRAALSCQYSGLARFMARRMLWDSVAFHLRQLANSLDYARHLRRDS